MDHPIGDVPLGADSHAAPLPELWQTMPPLKDAPSLPAASAHPGAKTEAPAPAAMDATASSDAGRPR